jgi:hypothetical protein
MMKILVSSVNAKMGSGKPAHSELRKIFHARKAF